jgi:hypothetical protein
MSRESLLKGREEYQALSLEEKRIKKKEKIDLSIKIWGMYCTDGMSMNAIANKLDLHPAKVSILIDFAARRIAQFQHPEAYTVKLKEVERLQALIDSLWKKILPRSENPDFQIDESYREDLKTYDLLTKRLDKLLGLNAPVKMAHQIQRVDAPKQSLNEQEGRYLSLIERLMERGRASPEEIAFYQAKKITPVSSGNQKQLPPGGAIESQIIDAEVVDPKTNVPSVVDITQDKVTDHGQVQLALFRTEEGSRS